MENEIPPVNRVDEISQKAQSPAKLRVILADNVLYC